MKTKLKKLSGQTKAIVMRVNHLIIGTDDLESSKEFYTHFLGFKYLDSFIDTGTGNQGAILRSENENAEELEILLVPFIKSRLPNPQHVAFEVNAERFNTLFMRAKELNMKIRAKPPLNSSEEGIGFLEVHSRRYKNFYVIDPARVNIEIMLRL